MMDDGLVAAYALSNAPRPLVWNDFEGDLDGTPVWVHLDRASERAREWLRSRSGLDPLVVDALLADETRPRVASFGRGMLIILRGVNLNAGADPDDMVALRVWLEPGRLITMRTRRLLAVQDVRDAIEAGNSPATVVEALVRLIVSLVSRMAPVVDGMDESLDELEERMISEPVRQLRTELAALRRTAIGLRRYLAPQRDVLSRLVVDETHFFDDRARARLRETVDTMIRYVEELDMARERAAVLAEELNGLVAERMNRTLYVLSLVGTVFLPLGFVTGLLGVNVAGIPGSDWPLAFEALAALLIGLAVFEVWLFRRWRLL
jgi:zinc transporter